MKINLFSFIFATKSKQQQNLQISICIQLTRTNTPVYGLNSFLFQIGQSWFQFLSKCLQTIDLNGGSRIAFSNYLNSFARIPKPEKGIEMLFWVLSVNIPLKIFLQLKQILDSDEKTKKVLFC